jgi:hypothetical protein
MAMYGCMLLCALPPPDVLSELNAALFVTEPDMVHAVAAWAVTARLVPLDAVCVLVVLQVVLDVPELFPELFGELYLNTGCVMVCASCGVFAAIVFACPCFGTLWLCTGKFAVCNVTVSVPPVDARACVPDTPRTTRPDMSGRLKVVEPSPAP